MIKTRHNKELEKYILWVRLPQEERVPKHKKDMAKHLGVHIETIYNWDKKLAKLQSSTPLSEFDKFIDMVRQRAFSPKTPTKERELYADLMGWRVKKEEVKLLVLTADDIAKANFKAERELRDSGFAVLEDKGMVEVPSES